jgi:hypothetical protein
VEITLTVSPIRNESGRIVGASKITHDISARRQGEKTFALSCGNCRIDGVRHEVRIAITQKKYVLER